MRGYYTIRGLWSAGRLPKGDQSEPLFVGYSARNRAFTQEFFSAAAEIAMAKFSGLHVAIFDVPYAYNDAAKLGRKDPTGLEIERAVAIGDERTRMVARTLAKFVSLQWTIQRWPDLDGAEAHRLRCELINGMRTDERLKRELRSQALNWAQSAGQNFDDNFLGFQVSELPLLVDLYYNRGLLVDLYPGNNTNFFFQLERGDWSSQLPIATRAARGKRLSALSLGNPDLYRPLPWRPELTESHFSAIT